MVGQTLGKYRIVERIGRGGMGVVYLGVDETLDRQVAIKAISPELVEEDMVRRFRAEAVTLAKVNHPNIASVYELFREQDRLLMVMELVRGQTFEQLLDKVGPMPVDRAASLTSQILDALDHAHRAGIVHRDLKPANLMLTDAGIVKVMDFGIARVAGTERMTTEGFMVGTPAYMAPEQVRGEEVDGRTDLYAVGVVFYRLVTGKLPFKAATAVAMIQSQLNDQPTPARTVRAELPDWLDAVLMRSLAKRPGDRYQNAEEFRRALDTLGSLGALAPLPDDVTVAAPATTAPVVAAVPSPAAAATPAAPSTTTLVLDRSHLAVVAGFGALLLIVVALLGWIALRRPDAPVQVVTVPAATPAPSASGPPTVAEPARETALKPAASPASVPARPDPPPSTPTPAPDKPVPPDLSPGGALFTGRGRRGGAPAPFGPGRGAAPLPPQPPANGAAQSIEFKNVHALVPFRGASRIVETVLTFGDKALSVADARNGVVVRTLPYEAIQYAFFSRSHLPRGAGGAELQMPEGYPEAVTRAPGVRLWLTLRTASERIVLRLDPPAVRPVLDLVEQRTKAKIERFQN